MVSTMRLMSWGDFEVCIADKAASYKEEIADGKTSWG